MKYYWQVYCFCNGLAWSTFSGLVFWWIFINFNLWNQDYVWLLCLQIGLVSQIECLYYSLCRYTLFMSTFALAAHFAAVWVVTQYRLQPQNIVLQPQNTQPQNIFSQPQNRKIFRAARSSFCSRVDEILWYAPGVLQRKGVLTTIEKFLPLHSCSSSCSQMVGQGNLAV